MPWAPSHPEHPIRSIRCILFAPAVRCCFDQLSSARFLKLEVLPVLAKAFEIKTINQPRITPADETGKVKKGRDPGVEFLWKVTDPNEAPPRRLPKRVKEAVGVEVGVNVNYQHLNARRQIARVGKITRDVNAMKNIQRLQPTRLVSTKWQGSQNKY